MGVVKCVGGQGWERQKAVGGKDDEPRIWEDRMEGQTPPSTFAPLLMSRNQGQEWGAGVNGPLRLSTRAAAPVLCRATADGRLGLGSNVDGAKNGQEKNGGEGRTKFGLLIDCVCAS
jgi:hypothetical protein